MKKLKDIRLRKAENEKTNNFLKRSVLGWNYYDMFAIPVSMFSVSRKQFFGTVFGFILTIMLLSMVILYGAFLTVRMVHNEEDRFSSSIMSVDFSND